MIVPPAQTEAGTPPSRREGNLNDTVDKVRRILTRRRWWILVTFSAIVVLTVVILYQVPDQYTSDATVYVVQQQVPERYVIPTSTTDISKAIEGIRGEVLSRARLASIIDEVGLYPSEKKRLAPEALINLMRSHVRIDPVESGPEHREINAFRISFTARNAHVAQQVTTRLTSLFITENLRSREVQATITTRFLHDQLDAAKLKLTEQEQRLRDFKMANLGELPEQQRGNVEILAGLQSELQATTAGLSHAQQQRLYLESMIRQSRRALTRREEPWASSTAPLALTPLEAARRELRQLGNQRLALLDRYSREHPDVISKDREIARQGAVVESLARQEKLRAQDGQEAITIDDAAGQDATELVQLNGQLNANRLEIENLDKRQRELQDEISKYENRLNLAPVREQQITGILRDYDLLKQNYADLLGKELQSQLATTLEKEQEGQQFRLVEPPSLPTVPSSPKRVKIALGSVAAAAIIGLALAFLIEMRDSALYNDADVTRQLSLPVITSIPFMPTPAERAARLRWQVFEWALASLLLIAVGAAQYYVYRKG